MWRRQITNCQQAPASHTTTTSAPHVSCKRLLWWREGIRHLVHTITPQMAQASTRMHQHSNTTTHLQGQLPSRSDDDGTRAVAWHELGSVQQLSSRNQERQRLARACAGSSQHITPCQQRWDGAGLLLCVVVCGFVRVYMVM